MGLYPKGRDEWEEERRPEKMMEALTKRARAHNLGARGGGGCSVQLAHHQCRGSPSPPPTHPRRAAPAAIPVKIFSRKSAKNGSLLLTWSHATFSYSLLSRRSYSADTIVYSYSADTIEGPRAPAVKLTDNDLDRDRPGRQLHQQRRSEARVGCRDGSPPGTRVRIYMHTLHRQ